MWENIRARIGNFSKNNKINIWSSTIGEVFYQEAIIINLNDRDNMLQNFKGAHWDQNSKEIIDKIETSIATKTMGIMIIRIGNMIEDLRDKMMEDLIDNSREDLIDNMIEDPICRDLLKEEITTRESIQIISILLLIIEIIVLLFGKEWWGIIFVIDDKWFFSIYETININ